MKVEDLRMFRSLRRVMNRIDVAYVATYPPRECGIATFTQDLVHSVGKFTPFSDPTIVALNDGEAIYKYPKIVRKQIIHDDLSSYYEAADYLNESPVSVVSLQHEFGIYGGQSGDYVIPFLARLKKPVVVTLHTVLPHPNAHQKQIIEQMLQRCEVAVTMINKGKEILSEAYDVDARKVVVIPHGVPNVPHRSTDGVKRMLGIADRIVLSTFGLINSGKGLEYVIQALPAIVEKFPNVVYLIIGETHPNVRRQEGEQYRNELVELAERLGVTKHVRFNNRFLPLDELINHLAATDVYITPYVNKGQIVSGTLAYAIGCGKAIVSTPYLYAEDVLSDNRGLLVEFRNPDALADAVIRILSDAKLRETLETSAYRYGRRTTWSNVAIDYLDVFDRLAQESRRTRVWTLAPKPRVIPTPALPADVAVPPSNQPQIGASG